MGELWPLKKPVLELATTYGPSGWAISRRSHSFRHDSMKLHLDFRRTATGLPMPPMNRAATRFTCSRTQVLGASGKFRLKAELSRFGRTTVSCFTGTEKN